MSNGGSMGGGANSGNSTTGISQPSQGGFFGNAQKLLGQANGNPFNQGYQPAVQPQMPAQMPNYGQALGPNFGGIPGNDALRNFQQQQYDQARLQQAVMQPPVSTSPAVPFNDQQMWAGGSPDGNMIERGGVPPMQQGLGSFMRRPLQPARQYAQQFVNRGRWSNQ